MFKQKTAQAMAIVNAQQMERSRIEKDIHDDIGSQLAKISLISELTKMENQHNPRMQTNLDKLSVTSRELTDSLKYPLKPS